MADDTEDLIPLASRGESLLDAAAVLINAIPWLGGPVSAVLSGMGMNRKLERVREALKSLATRLKEFKSAASEEYVKTDEFEELLEATLKRVVEEHADVKRRMFRDFLHDAIIHPGQDFDGRIKVLRALESLQLLHFRLLIALNMRGTQPTAFITAAPIQTMMRRLPDVPEAQMIELYGDLVRADLAKNLILQMGMTPQEAEELYHLIRPLGQQLLRFVEVGDSTSATQHALEADEGAANAN